MKLLKSGTVLFSERDSEISAGWQIEVCFDDDDTGGYYLLFASPDKSIGYDNWYLAEEDAYHQLRSDNILVEWRDLPPSAKPTLTK